MMKGIWKSTRCLFRPINRLRVNLSHFNKWHESWLFVKTQDFQKNILTIQKDYSFLLMSVSCTFIDRTFKGCHSAFIFVYYLHFHGSRAFVYNLQISLLITWYWKVKSTGGNKVAFFEGKFEYNPIILETKNFFLHL